LQGSNRKPLKDELLLQGLNRWNLNSFGPHSPPPFSVISPTENHEGDSEMKDY